MLHRHVEQQVNIDELIAASAEVVRIASGCLAARTHLDSTGSSTAAVVSKLIDIELTSTHSHGGGETLAVVSNSRCAELVSWSIRYRVGGQSRRVQVPRQVVPGKQDVYCE